MTTHNACSAADSDLYAVLGVNSTASGEQIRRAYRRRALALHPDRNPDPDAAPAFRAVAEAYAVLADPTRRTEYDTARTQPGPCRSAARTGPARDRAAAPPPAPDRPARPGGRGDNGDYAPTGDPVAHTDYAPTSGYAPPPPPIPRPPGPAPGGRAQTAAQSEPLPAGWPAGRIDHHRLLGRVLLGVWRLAPLPASRLAAGAVVAGVLAAAALAVTSREQMPLESTVIGYLAAFALACWTVRVLTYAVLHTRTRSEETR